MKDVDQRLDLWRGVIASRFTLGGVPVEVITACDSKTDSVAVRIVSDLVQNGTLRVRLGFPRGHDPAVKNTPALDWSHAEAHQSNLMLPGMIKRTIGQTNYFVISDRVFEASAEPHVFRIRPQGQSGELAFTLKFSPQETERAMRFDAVVQSSEEHWRSF